MKDLHSHLLYGLDDGTKSLEETLIILDKLYELGFDEMVLTPHYIADNRYSAGNRLKHTVYTSLFKRHSKIKLYYGNEVYIHDDIMDLIRKNEVMTLNHTRYLLLEFPFRVYYPVFIEYLKELISNGIIPILAHPERYIYFQNNPDKIREITKEGVLLQCNYGSIIDIYDKEANKLLKYLLKNDLVSFLSLDLHRDNDIIKYFPKIKKKIINLIGVSKFKELSDINIKKVIENDKI